MAGSWLGDVVKALENLGGTARLREIYEEVRRIRGDNLPSEWEAIVRATIETHSSNSAAFGGRSDIFVSVEGIGKGVWGLREQIRHTPVALDLEKPKDVKKTKVETYRVVRDTSLTRMLKDLHQNCCQICGLALPLSGGDTYSEAHHIKPLGSPHDGPDIAENILVLCPNHHVLLDYGAIEIDTNKLRKKHSHPIAPEFVEYHNTVIVKATF